MLCSVVLIKCTYLLENANKYFKFYDYAPFLRNPCCRFVLRGPGCLENWVSSYNVSSDISCNLLSIRFVSLGLSGRVKTFVVPTSSSPFHLLCLCSQNSQEIPTKSITIHLLRTISLKRASYIAPAELRPASYYEYISPSDS